MTAKIADPSIWLVLYVCIICLCCDHAEQPPAKTEIQIHCPPFLIKYHMTIRKQLKQSSAKQQQIPGMMWLSAKDSLGLGSLRFKTECAPMHHTMGIRSKSWIARLRRNETSMLNADRVGKYWMLFWKVGLWNSERCHSGIFGHLETMVNSSI